jgi:hypothetical protein
MTLEALLRALPPVRSDSNSGIPYVRWARHARRWHVRVDRRHVGYYRDLPAAVRAAVAAKGIL